MYTSTDVGSLFTTDVGILFMCALCFCGFCLVDLQSMLLCSRDYRRQIQHGLDKIIHCIDVNKCVTNTI